MTGDEAAEAALSGETTAKEGDVRAEAEDAPEGAPDADGAGAPEEMPEKAAGREVELARRAEACAARAVLAEARAAAAALGVKEARLDYAAKLAELGDIDPEEEDARSKIASAVREVLRTVPELMGGAGTGQTARARRPRRDAFERGFLGN